MNEKKSNELKVHLIFALGQIWKIARDAYAADQNNSDMVEIIKIAERALKGA